MALSRNRYFQITSLLFFLVIGITLYSQWYLIVSQIIEWQKNFHDLLASHINSISQNPTRHGFALIMLSFTYGVFHAIGPGHGKAVIIAYLSSNKESFNEARQSRYWQRCYKQS